MKNILIILTIVALMVLVSSCAFAQGTAANKYVGVKTCSMCHKADKTGNQFGIWQKTKHAEAFAALKTPKADEVAKAKGLKKPAAESPECLDCHTITADAAMCDKTFDAKDGVQCEACHGAGSAYKSMTIMKDKAKAIAAGLTEFKDPAAIEAKCKTCHNEKSPTHKPFVLKDMWAKIQHPLKKS
jgi:hypothetical protein